jgi:lysyl-tRNA synthetase class II
LKDSQSHWLHDYHGMKGAPLGKTIYNLFEAVVEPNLIQPTIIYDYPTEVSPLSKAKPDDPAHVERFEFFAGGFELGNAFSELNDPVEQHKRLRSSLPSATAATTRLTRWTRTTFARLLTACLRPAAKASASTGWSCCSPGQSRFGM